VVHIWAAFDSGAISKLCSRAITSAAMLLATCPLMKGRTGSVLRVSTKKTVNAWEELEVQRGGFQGSHLRELSSTHTIQNGFCWLRKWQAKSTLGRNPFSHILCVMKNPLHCDLNIVCVHCDWKCGPRVVLMGDSSTFGR
jgi:hypothetical protein